MAYLYPYGDTQQLNLDWLIEQWNEVKSQIDGSLQAEIDRVEAAITDLLTARDEAVAAQTAAQTSAQAAAGSASTASGAASTATAQAQAAAGSAATAGAHASDAQGYAATAQQAAQAANNSAAAAAVSEGNARNSETAAAGSSSAAAGNALYAEGYAKGTQNGNPVSSGSPYYENNAKYYSDQAAQDASDAADAAQDAQDVLDSIPADYTQLSNDVSELQAALNNKINSASFKVPDTFYKNIEYVDLLTDYSEIYAIGGTTASLDKTVRYKNFPYSVRFTTSSNQTTSDLRVTVQNGFPFLGTQEIDIYFYVADPSLITGTHKLRLRGMVSGFSKYYDGVINAGWNKIRFVTEGSGSPDFTKTENQWRFSIYTVSEMTVYIGAIYAVKPDKANLIVVDDHPYKTFYDLAYPAFKAINVPITWAGDWGQIGVSATAITETDLNVLAADGISEFSFHNYDGTEQASGTIESALKDTLNNLRYLRKNGLQPMHIWRAAWQGNNCAHPELANLEVEASASYNGNNGVTQFPWPDKYNIARTAMQARSTTFIDTIFQKIHDQHSTLIIYTHGISDDSQDVSTTLLNYYISKITDGINNGWLNPTTYSRLVEQYSPIEYD